DCAHHRAVRVRRARPRDGRRDGEDEEHREDADGAPSKPSRTLCHRTLERPHSDLTITRPHAEQPDRRSCGELRARSLAHWTRPSKTHAPVLAHCAYEPTDSFVMLQLPSPL